MVNGEVEPAQLAATAGPIMASRRRLVASAYLMDVQQEPYHGSSRDGPPRFTRRL
jgi:hypothetical protein